MKQYESSVYASASRIRSLPDFWNSRKHKLHNSIEKLTEFERIVAHDIFYFAFGGKASCTCVRLVNLLLLVDTELARTAVDQEQKATDNGQDLEEIVLGEVLVGVVFVKLQIHE